MTDNPNVIKARAAKQNSAAQTNTSRSKVFLIGGVCLAAAFLFMKMGGSDRAPIPQAGQAAPTPPPVEFGTMSSEAAEAQRQLELAELKRRLAEQDRVLQTQRSEFSQQLEAVETKLTREVQGLLEALERNSESRVRSQRTGDPMPSGVSDLPLPPGGGEFVDPQLTAQSRQSPYRRLGGGSGGSGASLPFTAGAGTAATGGMTDPLASGAFDENASFASQARPEAAGPGTPSPARTTGRTIRDGYTRIPAYSFATLRTLHGVPCPVATGISGSIGGLGTTSAPVVLPLVSSFKGPQGLEFQVPAVHLLGLCEGVDRKRPTAMVKVEQLSIIDEAGTAHVIEVNGYVVDARDNDLGVRGVKESVKGTQISLALLAAGVGAAGSGIQQGATDTIETAGGNIREVVRGGRLGNLIAGSTIGAGANELVRYFRERGATLFDVISVDAGTELRLIITEPIDLPIGHSVVESIDGRPLL
ncbi:hypothetical protein JN531_017010 (plasmid) [Flagellatimonas centrodinii]|uniref:hypothetical protein n=1 Tax=Flagellatimonas centrodinii TaxID=2806210 RepID=UPI001FEF813B|nr:hypothetical protein [Flagellatimonas centrodinii]ULQ48333.1 hypothetical protein JN531_017010 [Flagellatimonas centrodinii]